MTFRGMPLRAACLALATTATVGLAAGCGGSSSSSSSSSGQKKPPAKLAISVTGTKDDFKLTAPPKAQAGPAEITFTNNAKAETDAQLILVKGKREDAEIVAMLGEAVEGKAVASWFSAAGGIGTTKPGENATVTQDLKPGTYYVVTGDSAPKPPLPKIEVAMGQSQGQSTPPTAPAKVVATDYAFSGQNLKVGTPIELRNEGKTWHHFRAAPINEGATIEEVKKALASEGDRPPLSEKDSVGSAVMDPGISQIVQFDLKPGRYAFFCFVSDRSGGPPHVTKGMVSEVEVTE